MLILYPLILIEKEHTLRYFFQAETRPPSPQMDQNRMLRNVLLKAVQNLRRSQHREEKEGEQVQNEQELQLPKPPNEIIEIDIDPLAEGAKVTQSTKNISTKKLSPEAATEGKSTHDTPPKGKQKVYVYKYCNFHYDFH